MSVPSDEEILEENRRARRLRVVVDLVTSVISQSDMAYEEAADLVAATRQFALRLFPGKEETYNLIYTPRFQRLLREKYNMM